MPIATNLAPVTSSTPCPSPVPPTVAVMVAIPAPVPVANPWLPARLLMVAMAGSDEVQVTCVVMVCVEPSEYVPVAMYRCCVNRWIRAVAGEIAMLDSVAVVTVRSRCPSLERRHHLGRSWR